MTDFRPPSQRDPIPQPHPEPSSSQPSSPQPDSLQPSFQQSGHQAPTAPGSQQVGGAARDYEEHMAATAHDIEYTQWQLQQQQAQFRAIAQRNTARRSATRFVWSLRIASYLLAVGAAWALLGSHWFTFAWIAVLIFVAQVGIYSAKPQRNVSATSFLAENNVVVDDRHTAFTSKTPPKRRW